MTAAGDVAGFAADDAPIGGVAGWSGTLKEAMATLSKPITSQAGQKCAVGGIAGEAFRNVSDSKAVLSGIEGRSDGGMVSVGGLLGNSYMTVTGCSVENSAGVFGNAMGGSSCAVGGMLGAGGVGLFPSGNISNCEVLTHGSLTGQGKSTVNVGGFAGWIMDYSFLLEHLSAKTYGSLEATATTDSGQAFAGGLAGFAQSIVDDCGTFVQENISVNGVSSGNAGGALGSGGPVSNFAGWVAGSVLAQGADATAGGYAGAFVLGAIQNVAMDVAEVTVTAKPDVGYRLVEGSLVYRPAAGGDAVAIQGGSFAMPSFDVVVSAAFEQVPAPGPDPKPVPKPTPTSGSRLAPTGDATGGAIALAFLAVLAAGLALVLERRARA